LEDCALQHEGRDLSDDGNLSGGGGGRKAEGCV
jgi:hypothetical protein